MGLRGWMLLAALWLAGFAAISGAERWLDLRPGARLELSRVQPTRVDPVTLAALNQLSSDATLTYYVSPAADMPSDLKRMEQRVSEVLEALAAASRGRVTWRVVNPDAGSATGRFAIDRRIAPFRWRAVRGDRWSELEVWSSLEIALGARTPVVLDGLTPEQLPALQRLITAHLELLESPSAPRVALCAPPEDYAELAAHLTKRGCEVLVLDALGERTDWESADTLIWFEPRAIDDALLARVEAFRQRGGALLIGDSARRAGLSTDPQQPLLKLSASGFEPESVWPAFGLRALEEPLFDQRCEARPGPDGQPQALPFLVRCIAPNQDFRELSGQPQGTLLFPTPSPLRLNGADLADRGFRAQVLATSSEQSWTLPGLAREEAERGELPPLDLLALTPDRGRSLPKEALAVWLQPADPFEGPVFAFASSKLFSDDFLGLQGYEHTRLVDLIFGEAASAQRLVAARTDRGQAEPLPELSPAAESSWRAVALLGLPLPLLVLAALRGRGPRRAGSDARWLWSGPLGAFAAAGAVGLAGALLPGAWRLDFSAGELAGWAPAALAERDALLQEGPLEVTFAFTRETDLAPEWRLPVRDAWSRLREFCDVRGVELDRVDPERADEAQREALRASGVESVRSQSARGAAVAVRSIDATILLRHGERSEALLFGDVTALEDLEFRLACACWRLRTGRRPSLALVTDTPRLTAAENHTEYLQRRLFAPSGTDVWSLARGALEGADFTVHHVDQRRPEWPADADAIFWLQPQRAIEPVLEHVVYELHGGGKVFLAGQHFHVRAERWRGREFRDVYWPQPRSLDLDRFYLPEIGVDFSREVLLDANSFPAALETHVQRDADTKELDRQASALPFLVRATTGNFADDPLMAGVGDQALMFPTTLGLDPERLAALDLRTEVLMSASDRAWSFAWESGFLPPEVFDGPGELALARPDAPLLVRLEGDFPLPAEPLVKRAPEAAGPLPPPPAPGTLLLFGASRHLQNDRLRADGFHGDRLLVNAAAELLLPPSLAQLSGRRQVPRGLDATEEHTRLSWRGWALSSGPLLLLGAWLLRRIQRRLSGVKP
jgi:hypothetical protein